MKSKVTTMVALCLILATNLFFTPEQGTLTKEERSFAADYLKETRNLFFSEIKSLSDEQWSYKPSNDAWSIALVAEHIELAEGALMGRAKKLLESEPDFNKSLDIRTRIEELKKVATNRGQKFQAGASVVPEGKWKSPKSYIKHFKELRNTSIDYVMNTEDNLHSHFSPTSKVFGDMDAYLWIVLIAGHNQRHIEQIREIKARVDFPEK